MGNNKTRKNWNMTIALTLLVLGIAIFGMALEGNAAQQSAQNAKAATLSFAGTGGYANGPIDNPVTTRPPITRTTIPTSTTTPTTTTVPTTVSTTTTPTTLPTTNPTTSPTTVATTITTIATTLATTTSSPSNPTVNTTKTTAPPSNTTNTTPTTTVIALPTNNTGSNTSNPSNVTYPILKNPGAIYCYYFTGADNNGAPAEPFGCFNSQGSAINETSLSQNWPGFAFGGVLVECAGAVTYTGCNNVAYFFNNQSLGVGGIGLGHQPSAYSQDWLGWALINNNCLNCVGGATDDANFKFHNSTISIGSTDNNGGPLSVGGHSIPANYQTTITPLPTSGYTCLQGSQTGSTEPPNYKCSATQINDANGADTAHWMIEVFYPSTSTNNPGSPGGYLGPVCGANWNKYVGFYWTNSFESKILGSTTCSAVSKLSISVSVPNSTIQVGQNESIGAAVSGGTAPYTYNWYVNGNPVGTNSSSLTFHGNSTTLANSPDSVQVDVKDSAGNSASAIGNVTVIPALTNSSLYVYVPHSVIDVGQSEMVSATVFGSFSHLTYNWFVDGNHVGGNQSFITFYGNSTTLANSPDLIRVNVSTQYGQHASATNTITVNPKLCGCNVSVSVSNATIALGQSTTLRANVVAGTAPYTYVWTFDNHTVGTNSSSLVFHGNATTLGNDTVYVHVTDALNESATGHGNVNVVTTLSINQPKPDSQTVDQNQTATLNATAPINGVAPYTYQWLESTPSNSLFSNVTNCMNPTSLTCTFNTTGVQLGVYNFEIKVTDSAFQTATSPSSNVIVNPGLAVNTPIIQSISIDPIDLGQSANVTSSIHGGTQPYTYQWQVEVPGSVSFVNANSTICQVPSGSGVTNGQRILCQFVTNPSMNTGSYGFRLVAIDSRNQTVTSSAAYLDVYSKPSVTLSANSLSINANQSDLLTAQLANGSPGNFSISFVYSNGTIAKTVNNLPHNGSATYLFIPSRSGSYTFNAVAVDYGLTHPLTFSSNSLTINVNSTLGFGSPQITVSNAAIDVGQSTTLTANVVGGTKPYTSYVWTFDGNTIGTNSNTITFYGNATTLGSDTVTVKVTDSVGSSATGTGNVQVNSGLGFGSPQVTVSNAVIDEGQSTTLTANVIGGTTPYTSYVWKFNGNTIGTNSQTITFYGNASTLGSDAVTVTVTDSAGQKASGLGNVQVNSGLGFGSPQVTVSNAVINVGQSTTLVANVIGGTTPYTSYVWTFNGNTIGTNSNTLVFYGNSSTIGSDVVTVKVTDSVGQTATGSGNVQVNSGLGFGSPQVTVSNAVIDVGQSTTLTANVIGGTPPYVSYIWTFDGNTIGTNSKTITFYGNATTLGSDTVSVTVKDSAGSSATGSGNVQVNSGLGFGSPQIRVSNAIIDEGQSTTLVANVVGGTTPYTSYVWTFNGNTIGTNSNTITFYGNASTLGFDTVSVKVTDSAAQSAIGTGNVQVNSGLGFGSPQVTVSNAVIDEGQSTTLTANVIGGTTPYTSYVWTFNGNTIGTNSQTITFYGNASTLGLDTVSVKVTDSVGQMATGSGNVQVNSGITFGNPQINIPNSNLDIGQSETVVANVIGGSLPYKTFVWTENGNVVAGDNTNTLTFNAQVVGANAITVTVTDNSGNSASGSGVITVGSRFNNSDIVVSVPHSVIDVGQNEVITALVSGGSTPYTYSWMVNGNHVGGNSSTLTFYGNSTTLMHSPDGVSVMVTDAAGVSASASNTVTVNPALNSSDVSVTVPNSHLDLGQSEYITANVFGGTQPYSYVWEENGVIVPGATTDQLHFYAQAIGVNTITVIVTDFVGESGSANGFVTVNENLQIGQPTPQSQTIDQNQSATITSPMPTNGVAPYTYQWFEETPGSGTPVNAFSCANQTSISCTFNTNTLTQLGTYTFYIKATDSVGGFVFSPYAYVTVNPALNVTPPTIDPIVQTQTAHISDKIPSSGTGPTYYYEFLVQAPGSGSYSVANSICPGSATGSGSANTPVTCTFSTNTLTTPGTYEFEFQVTDSANVVTTSSPSPLILYKAPTVSLTPPTSSVDVGQNDVLSATLAYGSPGPYTVNFIYTNNAMVAAGITNVAQNGTATFTFVPSSTGSYTFNAVVTDIGNLTHSYVFGSSQVSATVSNGITLGSPQVAVSNSVIDVGQSTTLTANVIGGTAPYTYYWTWNGNHIAGNTQTITFFGNSSTVGNDVVDVLVTDSLGSTASGSGNVVVDTAPTVTITLHPGTSVDVGNTIYISYNITGGTAPFTVGNYLAYNAFGWNAIIPGNSFVFTNPGNYTISLNVTDGTGTKVTGSIPVRINKLPQIISFTAPTPYTGQQTTLSNTTIYGTSPFTYGYTVNAVVSGNYVATSNFTQSGNSFAFTVPGNYFITLTATDAMGAMATNSMYLNITNAPPTTTVPGGGGGGGGGGSGGSILPTIGTSGSCTTISQLYPPLFVNVAVNNNHYHITDNFITPTTAGITINNASYTLSPNVPVNITVTGAYTIYASLTNITYVPSGHMISLEMCVQNHVTTPTTTIPVSTNKTNSSSSGGQLKLNLTITKPLTNTTVVSGNTLKVFNLTKGGVAPYTYSYIVNPISGVSLKGNNFTFSNVGKYTIELTVIDSKGDKASANTIVVVSNSLAPSNTLTPSSTTSNSIAPAAIAVLIAIAMGVAYYGYARRRRRPAQ